MRYGCSLTFIQTVTDKKGVKWKSIVEIAVSGDDKVEYLSNWDEVCRNMLSFLKERTRLLVRSLMLLACNSSKLKGMSGGKLTLFTT